MWWTARQAVAADPPVKKTHKDCEEKRWPPHAGILAS
jgi:hypothetical protein